MCDSECKTKAKEKIGRNKVKFLSKSKSECIGCVGIGVYFNVCRWLRVQSSFVLSVYGFSYACVVYHVMLGLKGKTTASCGCRLSLSLKRNALIFLSHISFSSFDAGSSFFTTLELHLHHTHEGGYVCAPISLSTFFLYGSNKTCIFPSSFSELKDSPLLWD